MSAELRAGFVAGAAQILAALIALFGVLSTAPAGGGAPAGAGRQQGNSPEPGAASECVAVVDRYRRVARLDSKMLDALIAAGPDGVSPVEADPDARRCGISVAAIEAMR
ncbi:hypothetical protein OHA21_26395 [Actinoplanes sp. NBC_00393]|uniref:hypothetical protein n=1 Tax=Actinoplanes sp. NBC_00393 TaxID=2975953 RepID=UPI002E1A1BD8